jgi:hypothetical protein
MQWKMTAAMSGIGLVATWMASVPPPAPRAPLAAALEVAPAPAVVTPIEAEAARLARGLDYEARLGASSRNPFRFGATASAAALPAAADPAVGPAAVRALGPAVTFGLAGIATEVIDGAEVRTAILSGADGVRLARVGDTVNGYRVVAIAAAAVTLAGPDAGPDSTAVTLRLTP